MPQFTTTTLFPIFRTGDFAKIQGRDTFTRVHIERATRDGRTVLIFGNANSRLNGLCLTLATDGFWYEQTTGEQFILIRSL